MVASFVCFGLFLFVPLFETGSHPVAQASLKLKAILLPQHCIFSFTGMNVSVHHVCIASMESQQRTPDAPELELQTAVSHHMSDGNQVRLLCMQEMLLTTGSSL